MRQEHPAWDDYQRRRWMRTNAHLYVRHDADRYMKPGAIPLGDDAVNDGWLEKKGGASKLSAPALRASELQEARAQRTELLCLKWQIAALRFERALILRTLHLQRKANFNPNQPRVPAGNPDGGQWTSDGGGGVISDASDNNDKVRISPANELIHDRTGQESWKSYLNEYRPDGSLARQTVLNRDGSAIQSVFSERPDVDGWDERHAVRLADGSGAIFENSGATQTIYDRSGNQLAQTFSALDGSEPQAMVQPAFWQPGARVAIKKGIEAAAALFTWLSSRNSPESTAVFEFRAREFAFDPSSEQPNIPRVRQLTLDEVKQVCLKYDGVQERLNKATDEVRKDGKYKGPRDFGTKVHKKFADGINELDDNNYRAEVSVYKSLEAAKTETGPTEAAETESAPAKPGDRIPYGKLDTVRVDALERQPEKRLVCGYDPKTGKKPLTLPRMIEFVTGAKRKYPDTLWILLIEMRPAPR